MSLVQVARLHGRTKRVKPENAPPIVELKLDDNQTIVSIDLSEDWSDPDRKTADWSWTAYVATRL